MKKYSRNAKHATTMASVRAELQKDHYLNLVEVIDMADDENNYRDFITEPQWVEDDNYFSYDFSDDSDGDKYYHRCYENWE